ncbi:hypothetical protein I316_06972 [Kwoniella heveanensis BCC8398]|uniref:RING-type domain-containing protein n=1 Tax=Kwoniella heveanensis BCC8398 TaxID=1296120 RepID=A0A1B9GK46_9TREE|nr:hypothetical protein I316_06972 [Kwoniella heveanensis BCC8398]
MSSFGMMPTASTPIKHGKKEKSSQSSAPRIIRTFEEIKVPVNTEEWYEELECPIGATQSIVPCGHSFCGPCCWKWINANEQPSCPSCRVDVSEANNFVPNILIDQIIDRKLGGLPDGPEKSAMLIERKEKAQAWKVIQASITPVKAVPKRPRGLSDIIMNDLINLAAPPPVNRNGHTRRASRQIPELGAPVNAISDEDAEIQARLRSEAIRTRLAEMRRLRDERVRVLTTQVSGEQRDDAGPSSNSVTGHGGPNDPRRLTRSPYHLGNDRRESPDRMLSSPIPDSYASSRTGVLRSPAFARRQARGWADRGTRDDPLVVLSDEEE